jgi:hypothetical protein
MLPNQLGGEVVEEHLNAREVIEKFNKPKEKEEVPFEEAKMIKTIDSYGPKSEQPELPPPRRSLYQARTSTEGEGAPSQQTDWEPAQPVSLSEPDVPPVELSRQKHPFFIQINEAAIPQENALTLSAGVALKVDEVN